MSLCAKCLSSALVRTRWEKLQPVGEEVTVVHSWTKAESSTECALCQLVESEIQAMGQFEEEVSVLIRFIKLFLKLLNLEDELPPPVDEVGFTTEQDLSTSENVNSEDPKPEAPVASGDTPQLHSGPDDTKQPAESLCASRDSESRENSPRNGNITPEQARTAPGAKRSASRAPESGLWERARALVPSKRDDRSDVDREQLSETLASMRQFLSLHALSQNCVLCNSMEDVASTRELDTDRLKYNIKATTQSERETVVKYHSPPPDPIMRLKLRLSSIEKIDFVMEKRTRWSGIRLQEFRRDEKALRPQLGARPPPRGLFEIDPEEPHDPLGNSSAFDEWERTLASTPETALRKEYRQHAKDVCVLVPVKKERTWFNYGQVGFAREVKELVDVEVIKLWLRRCEKKHSLCAQLSQASCPPGLILIDTEKMCLVPVAPGTSVRYIALSYVWGLVNQPTLTRADLETWQTEGKLKELSVPHTIRDAIQLVRMVEYRYLWVDALCIIQDDTASRHGQISQMHEIYRHADMAIVAADGDSCASGLPGVTAAKDRVYKHRRYELPGGLCLMKVPSSTRHGIEMSPWRKRGWTFQEELCSRRTLVLLPEVMLFSCASAVWREDLELETEASSQRSGEGLVSLASLLHPMTTGNTQDLLVLFRDLVKKYMQRTLSRTDDMEDAFAGVAGMLEPYIGPVYHGIPEGMFAEVIRGSWFWDTSLRRRAGFPSWSWTGWIYRQEQADVGIQPVPGAPSTGRFLTFYKAESSGIELLGQSGLAGLSGERVPAGMDAELRGHFTPYEEDIRSETGSLQLQEGVRSGLIAFYTSLAYLRLRTPPGDTVGTSREYRVFHPHMNRQLTSIRLNVSYVAQRGTLLPFIVVDHDPDRRSFRLMLISVDGTAERVNVTSQGRLVKEDDWKGLNPERKLIFMS